MSTHALVGFYSGPKDWRAVFVHYDGYPEGPGGVGAKLLRAVRLCGGDPRPVLDHLFSTKSWSAWPGSPHPPDGDDLPIFTPTNRDIDVAWLYLFDLATRRLDLIRGDRLDTEPHQSVALDDPREPWGPCALTLADLAPVAGHFHRVAAPAVHHGPDGHTAWPDPYRPLPETPAGPPAEVLAALRAVRPVLFDEALMEWARAALERVAIVPYPCAVARVPASPFARSVTRVWVAGVEWVVPDRVAASQKSGRVEADTGAFLWASTNAAHWDDDVAAALVLANAALRELIPELDVEIRFASGRFVCFGERLGREVDGVALDALHEGCWLAVVLRWFGWPAAR